MTRRACLPALSLSFAALALGAAAPRPALADDLLTNADSAVVLDVAKGFGSASLESDSNGAPKITGRMDGQKYFVYFYGCDGAKNCRSIQLFTGYSDAYTIEAANKWNVDFRWIKASSQNGSNFTMDVDFRGGITRDHLEAQFSTWQSFVEDIQKSVEGK